VWLFVVFLLLSVHRTVIFAIGQLLVGICVHSIRLFALITVIKIFTCIKLLSTVFADRLQIYGQADRELVLSRLYLLHTSTSNTGNQELASSSCSTAESVFMPTAVRVYERERIDSDLASELTEDVPETGYCLLYFVTYCFQLYTQVYCA